MEFLWQATISIINQILTVAILYHNTLCGFQAGLGMGTATLRGQEDFSATSPAGGGGAYIHESPQPQDPRAYRGTVNAGRQKQGIPLIPSLSPTRLLSKRHGTNGT